MRGLQRLFWVICLWIGFAGMGFAQFSIPNPIPSVSAPAPTSLRSPRVTFDTFLEAMRRGDLSAARSTLDLSSILAPLRESEGGYRAKQLLFVIDRTKAVNLDKVSDEKDGEPYVFSEYSDPASKMRLGEVAIAKGTDGAWRFTSESVQLVPTLFRNLQDAPSRAYLGVDEGNLQDLGQVGRSLAPASWRVPFLFLELWQWAGIGILLAISIVLVPLLRAVVHGLMRIQVPYFKGDLSFDSERRLRSSVAALVIAELWHFGLPYVNLPDGGEAAIVFLLRLLSGAALAWLLTAIFDALVDVAGQVGSGLGRRTENILIPVVRKFGKTLILIGTALFVASALGFNLFGVIAGLGIGGLVVALAAKDSVENLFGSFTILFDMPFGIGDWVKIGNIDGVVEQINLRSTRIRTFSDSVITLPNSNLIKASVENMGQRRYRRFQAMLGLEYGTAPETVDEFCVRLRRLMEEHPKTRKDTIRATFFEFGDSALNIKFDCYLEVSTYPEEIDIRHHMLLDIQRIAEELGVRFAFPSQTLYVHKGQELQGEES